MKKENFGGFIRQLREQAGLSLKEVSVQCGWESVVYLSDIERGKRNPPGAATIKILAKLYKTDFTELENLAIKSQEKLILPMRGGQGARAEVGLQLARAWETMTDENMSELADFIKTRVK